MTQAASAGQTVPASIGRPLPFPRLRPGTYSFKSSLAGAVSPEPATPPGSSQENKTPKGRRIPGWSSPAPRARSRMRRRGRESRAWVKRRTGGRRAGESHAHRAESPLTRPRASSLFTSVQFRPDAQSRPTLCDPVDCQASLSITNSRSSLKLMSTESVMPSNHLILCRPLLLPPSIFPASGSFKSVSSSHQVAKVLELQHQSFQ